MVTTTGSMHLCPTETHPSHCKLFESRERLNLRNRSGICELLEGVNSLNHWFIPLISWISMILSGCSPNFSHTNYVVYVYQEDYSCILESDWDQRVEWQAFFCISGESDDFLSAHWSIGSEEAGEGEGMNYLHGVVLQMACYALSFGTFANDWSSC